MHCHKKRIRSLKRNFPYLQLNKSYYFAVRIKEKITSYAIKAGFPLELNLGDTVLPNPECGPISDFNANGKEVINKSKGKEDHTYQTMWTHEEFRGRDEREKVTSLVNRTIKRWCRDKVKAPEINLTIIENINKEKFITCPLIIYLQENESSLIHMVNLMLEIFKECTVLDNSLSNIIVQPKYNYVNWTIMPAGDYPFSRIINSSEYVLNKVDKYILKDKERVYLQLPSPDICYCGRAGFNGYIVMEYKLRNMLIFENIHYGNATYIFEGKFKEANFRSLTKKDILDGNLHKDRIIHGKLWEQKIKTYFS